MNIQKMYRIKNLKIYRMKMNIQKMCRIKNLNLKHPLTTKSLLVSQGGHPTSKAAKL